MRRFCNKEILDDENLVWGEFKRYVLGEIFLITKLYKVMDLSPGYDKNLHFSNSEGRPRHLAAASAWWVGKCPLLPTILVSKY